MGKNPERFTLSPQEAGFMGCGRCYNLNQKNEGGNKIYTCGKLETPLLSALVGVLHPPLHRYISNTVDIIICPLGLFADSVPNINDAVCIEQQKRDA